MPTYTLQLPNVTDPARVDAWLVNHGYTLEDGSSVRGDGTVVVSVDRDPSGDAAAYQDQPTSDEQTADAAWTLLRAYVAKVKKIAPANRTDDQRAILALLRVLANMADAT
jgi:hypothetical protein